jgi:hypothetical protein
MRTAAVLLIAFLVSLNLSQFAASKLPIVVSRDFFPVCSEYRNLGEVIPLKIVYTNVENPATRGKTGGLIQFADSHHAATLNVDGTWSISPWWLFRSALRSDDPGSLEWRVLIASFARGEYANSHFCNKES